MKYIERERERERERKKKNLTGKQILERERMVKEIDSGLMPGWLQGLLDEPFFGECGSHESSKKNEKNVFCLFCCRTICSHCLPSHRSHRLLQVRRYVYHDVARLDDLDKLINSSYIQPYTINNAKVVFLKQRPQSRHFKGSGNNCLNCDRILQTQFHFCSLSCKVNQVLLEEGDLSNILHGVKESEFAFSKFEGLRMDCSDLEEEDEEEEDKGSTPSSILEGPRHGHFKGGTTTSSSSSCYSSNNARGSLGISEDPEVVKNTNNNNGILPEMMLSFSRRKKGAPHRSPLC